MEATKILQADILDIIFEDKNKLYGAYNLRKFYNKRLFQAILFTGCVVFLFLGIISFINSKKKLVEKFSFANIETVLSQIKVDNDVKEKTLVVKSQKTKSKALLPPVIKKDSEVDPSTKIETINNEDVISNVTNENGVEELIVGVTVAEVTIDVDTIGTKAAIVSTEVVKENESIYRYVQQEASFPGGFAAWRKFLMRELDAEKPSEAGAAPGAYTVIVEFIVSKDGALSDIHVQNKIGFGIDEEAMRAIKKGPKWLPAKQNNLVVNAFRKQPITFVVPED